MAGPVENGNLEFSRVCLDRLQPIDLPRLSLVRLQLGDPGIIAISESVDIAKVRAAVPVRVIRVDPASTLWPNGVANLAQRSNRVPGFTPQRLVSLFMQGSGPLIARIIDNKVTNEQGPAQKKHSPG